MNNDLKYCPYCHQTKGPLAFAHDLKGERPGHLNLQDVCGSCAVHITALRAHWRLAVREKRELLYDIRDTLQGAPIDDGREYREIAGGYVTLPAPNYEGSHHD